VQGAAKPNLQGGATPVLPRDTRQGVPVCAQVTSADIFKPSMGARNLAGIGLSYRPARLVTYAGGIILWNRVCFSIFTESGGK
jgi:hypothetical protein